ncbi:MAG TPA: hypothetical protein VHI98_26380 [Vicinamibacterales bacterium]|jgi:hypothetical protein|nr:hypothetical protein [Vicinamibacterales bacterium]
MRARGFSDGGWHTDGELPPADGYRRLSVRVIEQAFRDVVAAPGSAPERHSARVFLAGSPMLHLWCQLAALDPAQVVARAIHLVENQSVFGQTARRVRRDAPALQVKSTI